MSELSQEHEDRSVVILAESGYGILKVPMNYVVSKLKVNVTSPTDPKSDDFDASTYEYYSTLSSALVGLSNNLIEKKLKLACKERPLELKELADLIKNHNQSLSKIAQEKIK